MSLQSDLMRYLDSGPHDEKRRREDLALAMHRHIRRSIARRCSPEESQDVVGQCMLKLWPLVEAMRQSGRCTVGNFDAYTAKAAGNCLTDGYRRRSPAYRNTANEVKALLHGRLNASGISTWTDPSSEEEIAGFDIWRNRRARMPSDRFADNRSRDAFADRWLGGEDPGKCRIDIMVEAVLSSNGAPMPVSRLVDIVCRLRGTEQASDLSLDSPVGDDGTRLIDLLRDHAKPLEDDVVDRTEMQTTMARLWEQMKRLAVRQLVAVCLKLQPDEFMALAVVAGPSTFAIIFEVDADVAVLARFAADLPMQDDRIAAILGVGEQTVRNIRSAALKTLGRRWHKEFPDDA